MRGRACAYLVFFLGIFSGPAELDAQVLTDQVEVGLSLQEVALLDIEPGGSVVLNLDPPVEAGLPLQSDSDNSSWLNYSLCIESTDSDHYITVDLASGSVPAGLELTVEASSYSGFGAGTLGTSAGPVVLSSGAQVLINGIRGAYTGDGVNNGHQLTYQLTISDYSQVDFDQSSNILITYTITD